MPTAPLSACGYPRCPGRAPFGKRMCVKHEQQQRRQHNRERQAQLSRDYDGTWRKLRARYLSTHPLCECDDCGAGLHRVTPAQVVDHIEPIALHPELRLDERNLRAMSKSCHDKHTARTRGWGRDRGSRPLP